MGTFFVIPVYLQVVLGFDAFETGKRLLPLSLAMLVFALLGPRIAGRRSPRTVAQLGLVAVSIGAIVMLATLDVKLNDTGFKVALALVGAGAGLLASQLGNVIMSSVAPAKSSEAGGLQGTAQNLGSSLGTAIIGAVLLAALATGFSQRITDNPDIPQAARDTIVANAQKGIDIVPVETVEKAAVDGGLTEDQARAVADDYGDAQLDALRLSLGAVALAALLSLSVTRRLPTTSLANAESPPRSRRQSPKGSGPAPETMTRSSSLRRRTGALSGRRRRTGQGLDRSHTSPNRSRRRWSARRPCERAGSDPRSRAGS